MLFSKLNLSVFKLTKLAL
jgi:hypothetical protein